METTKDEGEEACVYCGGLLDIHCSSHPTDINLDYYYLDDYTYS